MSTVALGELTMDRVSLGNGKWFDRDKAVDIDEGSWHDGNNYISRATGSQWEHERLYYTRKGVWVICRWSQRQGCSTAYSLITDKEAMAWIIDNQLVTSEDRLADLPEGVRLSLLEGMKGQEV